MYSYRYKSWQDCSNDAVYTALDQPPLSECQGGSGLDDVKVWSDVDFCILRPFLCLIMAYGDVGRNESS